MSPYKSTSTIAIIFFLTFFLKIDSIANHTTDSLVALLKIQKEDTIKVRTLAAISIELSSQNPAEAMRYARQVLELSLRLNFSEGEALAYNRFGLSFERQTSFDSAFKYYFISNKLYSKQKHGVGEATTLRSLGILHGKIGSYDSAAIYFFKSLKIGESIHDKKIQAGNLNNICILMKLENKFDEALDFGRRALELYEQMGDKSGIASVCANLSSACILKNDFALAEKYLNKSLEIYTELHDQRGMGSAEHNIAANLLLQGRYNEAIIHGSTALGYYEKTNDLREIAKSMEKIAEIYIATGKYSIAEEFSKKALDIAIRTKEKKIELDNYQLLHQINSKKRNYKIAYSYLLNAQLLNDSIFNEKKTGIINDLKTKYETEKKEKELAIITIDNDNKNLELKNEKLIRNSLIAGSILIALLSFLIFNRIRLRKKIEQQEAVIEERRRISLDMHDDLGSNLSKISLMSEVLKRNTQNAKDKDDLDHISASAQNALEKMSEIVWTLNPKNDKLSNLLAYIRKYAVEYFEPTAIECRIIFPAEIADIELTGEQRRNIFLSVKESLHNVVKHSGASKAEIKFTHKSGSIEISIFDNGKGIDLNAIGKRLDGSFGNGLESIRERMKKTNGMLQIDNNMGTLIRLIISNT